MWALEGALSSGYDTIDVVKILLEKGADYNIKDDVSYAALLCNKNDYSGTC